MRTVELFPTILSEADEAKLQDIPKFFQNMNNDLRQPLIKMIKTNDLWFIDPEVIQTARHQKRSKPLTSLRLVHFIYAKLAVDGNIVDTFTRRKHRFG